MFFKIFLGMQPKPKNKLYFPQNNFPSKTFYVKMNATLISLVENDFLLKRRPWMKQKVALAILPE